MYLIAYTATDGRLVSEASVDIDAVTDRIADLNDMGVDSNAIAVYTAERCQTAGCDDMVIRVHRRGQVYYLPCPACGQTATYRKAKHICCKHRCH